jgi:hypothetical protein
MVSDDVCEVHTDPWRVLRIQSEFVEGFGALAEVPRVCLYPEGYGYFGDPVIGEGVVGDPVSFGDAVTD